MVSDVMENLGIPKLGEIKEGLFSESVLKKSFKHRSKRGHEILTTQHSCNLDEDHEPQEFTQTEVFQNLGNCNVDKKTFKADDTITCIAACKNFIAWGAKSKVDQDSEATYGVFLSKWEGGKYSNPNFVSVRQKRTYSSQQSMGGLDLSSTIGKGLNMSLKQLQSPTMSPTHADGGVFETKQDETMFKDGHVDLKDSNYSQQSVDQENDEKEYDFYPTGSKAMIQALSFDADDANMLLCGDNKRGLFLFDIKHKRWNKFESEHDQSDDKKRSLTCLNFKWATESTSFIAIGYDDKAVCLYILTHTKGHEKKIEPLMSFLRPGLILGVCFAKFHMTPLSSYVETEDKNEHPEEEHISAIELVVADNAGYLAVYNIEHMYKDHNGYYQVEKLINFKIKYDLSVEAGQILSCSADCSLIAVGCGDKKVRVLKRMYHQDLKDPRDAAANSFQEAKSAYLRAIHHKNSCPSDATGLLTLLEMAAQKIYAANTEDANVGFATERLAAVKSQFKALSETYLNPPPSDRSTTNADLSGLSHSQVWTPPTRTIKDERKREAAKSFEEAEFAYHHVMELAQSNSKDYGDLLLRLYKAAQKIDAANSYLKGEKPEKANIAAAAERLAGLTSQIKTLCKTDRQNLHDSWEETTCFEAKGMIFGVGISGNGRRVAVATDISTEVFDVAMGCEINIFESQTRVRSVCLNFEADRILFGGFGKEVGHYNINSGFSPTYQITEIPAAKAIQSVSLDSKGKWLATGVKSGQPKLYDLEKNEEKKLHSNGKDTFVYVVKLSPDGKLLAAGDYSAKVVVFSTETGDNIMEVHYGKNSGEGGGICFIWGLDFVQMNSTSKSNNKYRLAVGCWDSYAYVYDLTVEDPNPKGKKAQYDETIKFKLPDRVYDVSLSGDGCHLAACGRFKKACVFDIKETTLKYEIPVEKRLYCIALSPKNKYIAIGGVTNKVQVYKVDLIELRLQEKANTLIPSSEKYIMNTYAHDHVIHRLEFMNEDTLAAVSEDGKCKLYDLNTPVPLIQLSYNSSGNSVAINKNMIAVAHGMEVSVYGHMGYGFGPRDRPSLALAEEFLGNLNSMKIALNAHPTMSNLIDERHNSLLHKAVETQMVDTIKCILNTGCPCGLLMNKQKMNPLMIAIKNDWKAIVEILLSAVNNQQIVNSPEMFSSLFLIMDGRNTKKKEKSEPKATQPEEKLHAPTKECLKDDKTKEMKEMKEKKMKKISPFELLGTKYPDLLLSFLADMKLISSEPQVLGDIQYMPLEGTIYMGLSCRSPKDFWKNYYEEYKDQDEAFQKSTPFYVEAYKIPIPGICGHGRSRNYNEDQDSASSHGWTMAKNLFSAWSGFKNHSKKKENNEKGKLAKSATDYDSFADPSWSKPRNSWCIGDDEDLVIASPLEIIVDAAHTLKDYSVFKKGTVVHALVMYKWHILKSAFIYDSVKFVAYLIACSVLSFFIRTFEDYTFLEAWFSVCFLFVALSFGLGYCSIRYLMHEFNQLKQEYKALEDAESSEMQFKRCRQAFGEYISDFWNIIDVSAFFSQLLTDVFFVFRVPGTRGVGALAIILLFFKLLFYARGSKEFGPFVRMIQRIVQDMYKFLMVMLVFFIGFAIAFDVLLGGTESDDENESFHTIFDSLFAVTLMIYGEFDTVLDILNGSWLAILLFEALLLLCIVIMLNLLVAIMNDCYSDVMSHAQTETVFELAKIIVELEMGDHVVQEVSVVDDEDIKHAKLALFPRWVHVLTPHRGAASNDKCFETHKNLTEIKASVREIANTLNGIQNKDKVLNSLN